MKTTNQDIDHFLASLPDEVRGDMVTLDAKISKIMEGETRKLWIGKFWGGSEQKIIGYADCEFTNSKKEIVKWFTVGLALQKNYISVYIIAKENGMYAVKNRADKLGKVKTGASSISFKKLADVHLDELLKLVELAKTQVAKS